MKPTSIKTSDNQTKRNNKRYFSPYMRARVCMYVWILVPELPFQLLHFFALPWPIAIVFILDFWMHAVCLKWFSFLSDFFFVFFVYFSVFLYLALYKFLIRFLSLLRAKYRARACVCMPRVHLAKCCVFGDAGATFYMVYFYAPTSYRTISNVNQCVVPWHCNRCVRCPRHCHHCNWKLTNM